MGYRQNAKTLPRGANEAENESTDKGETPLRRSPPRPLLLLVAARSRAAAALNTSYWRQSLTDACASRGNAKQREVSHGAGEAGRPTGHGRAEKRPCGRSKIGAMAGVRPCSTCTHVKTDRMGRQRAKMTPQVGGVRSEGKRNYERNYKTTVYHVISLRK